MNPYKDLYAVTLEYIRERWIKVGCPPLTLEEWNLLERRLVAFAVNAKAWDEEQVSA